LLKAFFDQRHHLPGQIGHVSEMIKAASVQIQIWRIAIFSFC